MSTDNRVGFIGLGRMGHPMARNLLQRGFSVTVHDRLPAAMARLVELGAVPASSPAEAAAGVKYLITMLPADAQVEEVLVGPEGALGALPRGSIVIQMSTIKPGTVQRLGPRLAERGVGLVDCPVSRGARVWQAELCIYAGGEERLLAECRPVLDSLATEVLHVGPLGMGQAAKLINNLALMTNVASVCEGLVLGRKLGLEASAIIQVVSAGSGSSFSWRTGAPRMVAREFEPEQRFAADLAHKDVQLALQVASEVNSPTMLGAIAQNLFGGLLARGAGDHDYLEVITVLEKMADFRIS